MPAFGTAVARSLGTAAGLLLDRFSALAAAARSAVRNPGRHRDRAVQIGKGTAAAVLSWWIADRVLHDPLALMAPWVAVVLVQVTVYRSLLHGVQQLLAIVLGTLLAGAAMALLGNTIAAMAVVLPVTLLVGAWWGFGAQGVYGSTTALFTLAYGSTSAAILGHRLVEAALGAAIGIGINTFVLPPTHLRSVGESLRAVADEAAGTLGEVGDALAGRDWNREAAHRWDRRARHAERLVEGVRSARSWSRESLRWNPVRPRKRLPAPPPEEADERWSTVVAHLTSLTRTLCRVVDEAPGAGTPAGAALAEFGAALQDCAAVCAERAQAPGSPGPQSGSPGSGADRAARARERLDRLFTLLTGENAEFSVADGDAGTDHAPPTAVFGSLLLDARSLAGELGP